MSQSKADRARQEQIGYKQGVKGKGSPDLGWYPSHEKAENIRTGFAKGANDRARDEARRESK